MDEPPWSRSEAPSAVAAAASGAAEVALATATGSSCMVLTAAAAPSTPSPTRQHSPRIARWRSSSYVSAKRVTANTTASKKVSRVSTALRRTSVACWAMLASLAAALAAMAACPEVTMLAIPVAIYARNVNPASRAFVVRVMGFLLKRGPGLRLGRTYDGQGPRVPRSLFSSALERLTEPEAQHRE